MNESISNGASTLLAGATSQRMNGYAEYRAVSNIQVSSQRENGAGEKRDGVGGLGGSGGGGAEREGGYFLWQTILLFFYSFKHNFYITKIQALSSTRESTY